MVNEPGKLAGVKRAREKEQGAGQFAVPQREEEQNYEQLLDQYGARKFAEGEVMKGTVLKITDTDVIVDIGYKSEGVIPVAQFIDPIGNVTIKVGDVIDVLLEDTEDMEGHIVLSKEKAEKVKVWEEVEKAYNENSIIRGRVIERIKGGLSVDIGIRAFLPGFATSVGKVKVHDLRQVIDHQRIVEEQAKLAVCVNGRIRAVDRSHPAVPGHSRTDRDGCGGQVRLRPPWIWFPR